MTAATYLKDEYGYDETDIGHLKNYYNLKECLRMTDPKNEHEEIYMKKLIDDIMLEELMINKKRRRA